MKSVFKIIFLLLVLVSCQHQQHVGSIDDTVDSLSYSCGYQIKRAADYNVVEVIDPWNKNRLLQRYILVNRNKELPKKLPEGTVVRVPVKNIVVYNSVHSAILEMLQVVDDVVGACEVRYMGSPEIRKRLDAGKIIDLGQATAPNVEKMVQMRTEVVFVSPFQNAGYGPVEKLGIPIIECADYMESTPLGRAEWIRFYGMLTGKEALADSLFHDTEKNYLQLRELVSKAKQRPTLIVEKKHAASWYVPLGESYMARFYKDAGADYVFADTKGAGSTPMAFEAVYEKGVHADFWLMKYNLDYNMTYSDLKSEYSAYSNFDAFKKKSIFVCNTANNDFYEEFPMNPHYLLKDLVWVFHPDLIESDYQPRYYMPMKVD